MKLNQTNLFLIVIAVFLQLPQNDASCTFTETARKTGQISYVMIRNFTTKTRDNCKQWCVSRDTCVAVDYTPDACFMFYAKPPLEDNPAGIHYDKTCEPDVCTMVTRLTDTKGTSSSVVKVAMSSVEDCRGICKYLGDCEAVSYTNGICSVYNGVIPTMETDSVDYHKVNCSNGNRCCMDKTSDKKANASAVLSFSQTVESCETACLNYDNCEAVHYKDNVCYFHLTIPNKFAETGSTLSVKSCDPGAPDGTANITDSCPETENLAASGGPKRETLGTDGVPSTDTRLPGENRTGRLSMASGTQKKKKIRKRALFSADASCTFTETARKIGDNSKIKDYIDGGKTKDDCKQWCLSLNNCVAVDHKEGYCFLFEETPVLEDNPAGTHYDKTCTPETTTTTTELTTTVTTTTAPTTSVATTTEPTTSATTTEPTTTVATTTEPTSTVATTTEPTSTVATTTEPTATIATTTEPTTMPVDGSADKMADIRKLLESNPAVVAAVAVASVSLLAFCVFLACFIRKRKRALQNKSETDDSLISANGKNYMTELPGYYSPPITSGVACGISREKRHIPYQCHVDPMIDFHRRKLGYFSNEAYTFSLDHIIPRVALGGKKS